MSYNSRVNFKLLKSILPEDWQLYKILIRGNQKRCLFMLSIVVVMSDDIPNKLQIMLKLMLIKLN